MCLFLFPVEKEKLRMTSYLHWLLLQVVSFMKIRWKPTVHKISSSIFRKVWYCHITMAYLSSTAADNGAGHAMTRATSTITLSFAVAQPNDQESAILRLSLPQRRLVPVHCCLWVPYSYIWGNRACLLDDSHSHGCSQLCSCITQCVSVCLVLEANLLGLAEGSH